jgi:hypothetical protein
VDGDDEGWKDLEENVHEVAARDDSFRGLGRQTK